MSTYIFVFAFQINHAAECLMPGKPPVFTHCSPTDVNVREFSLQQIPQKTFHKERGLNTKRHSWTFDRET